MARILIVDDDDTICSLVALILTQAGHTAIAVQNGRDAARLLHREPYDLVITDILMPERDGLETIMALRREKKQVPVIAMSGMSRDAPLYLEVAKKLGAVRTLAKPFTGPELVALVNGVLQEPPPTSGETASDVSATRSAAPRSD
jgi:DNA-binding response OmpR family regulator